MASCHTNTSVGFLLSDGFPIHSRVVNRQMLQDQVFHRLPKECMKESDVTRFWMINMISSLMWAFW